MEQTGTPAPRRNGKLSSCEPCRLAKTKCDHAMPVCGRCSSRNLSAQCIYHPAPMTRSSADTMRDMNSDAGPLGGTGWLSSGIVGELPIATAALSCSLGYLGPTSFTAVLSEHMDADQVEELAREPHSVTPVDTNRIQVGSRILMLLQNPLIHNGLINRYYQRSANPIIPITVIHSAVSSVHAIVNTFSLSPQTTHFLNWSTRVFEASSKRLQIHRSMTPEEYCSMLTGDRLRWEVIGALFSVAGLSLMTITKNDALLMNNHGLFQDVEQLLLRITDAMEHCILFCNQACSANEILVGLLCNSLQVLTMLYGDSSHLAWRRLADLSGIVYASGIHNLRVDIYPSFLQQWRRIIFSASFYLDKNTSTFLGRPPLIGQRYCDMTPPIDIKGDDLLCSDADLNTKIKAVQSNGWNKNSDFCTTSFIRLRFLLAINRDEILELSLRVDQNDFEQRFSDITQKLNRLWEDCPTHLRYDHISNNTGNPALHDWNLLLVYLDHKYSIFLLQKTFVKIKQSGYGDLYDTAKHMLCLVLSVSQERDRISELNREYSWILLYYGLPAASMLAIALLRNSKVSKVPKLPFARSEVIRSLSVFVHCLQWVARPGYGNYGLCKESESKLTRILDKVIDSGESENCTRCQGITSTPLNEEALLESLFDWGDYNTWDLDSILMQNPQ